MECPRILIKAAVNQDLGCAPHLSICGAVSGLGVKSCNSCSSSYCNNNNKINVLILVIGNNCYCSVQESPSNLKEHYQCTINSLQEGSMRLTTFTCVLRIWRCSQMCFNSSLEPICAVGQGVAALCCATKEDKSWVFQGYSLTGVRQAFTWFLLFGGLLKFLSVWFLVVLVLSRNFLEIQIISWVPWLVQDVQSCLWQGAQHWVHEKFVLLKWHVGNAFPLIVQ